MSIEQTVARLDVEPNVPLERVVKRLPVVVLVLLPSNERVHQNGTLAWGTPGAVSGATHLLETISLLFYCFSFYLLLQPDRLQTLFNVGNRLNELLRDVMSNRTSLGARG